MCEVAKLLNMRQGSFLGAHVSGVSGGVGWGQCGSAIRGGEGARLCGISSLGRGVTGVGAPSGRFGEALGARGLDRGVLARPGVLGG